MILNLEKECGVTRISLENAEKLLQEYGRPSYVQLFWDKDEWCCTHAVWLDEPEAITHTFTGFSWGYGGEGPRGLSTFFRMIDVPIKLEEIATWDDDINQMVDVPKGE